jgi:hypothetical protein
VHTPAHVCRLTKVTVCVSVCLCSHLVVLRDAGSTADAVMLWSMMHLPDDITAKRTSSSLIAWGRRANAALSHTTIEAASLRARVAALERELHAARGVRDHRGAGGAPFSPVATATGDSFQQVR